MSLLKLDHPVVFLAAQGKCGKGYMWQMIASSITYTDKIDGKVVQRKNGASRHEHLIRPMDTNVILNWSEPTDYLKEKVPKWSDCKFENGLEKAEEVWHNWTMPLLLAATPKGLYLDAESRFVIIGYYFAKKYLHPDSMRIIIMRRPLAGIAYHNCVPGTYKYIPPGIYKLGNLVPPWCKHNLTVTPKTFETITKQELCVWYTFEMEERKKRMYDYFPDVRITEWDMETDTKSEKSWYKLLDFLSSPKQKLEFKPWMGKIIEQGRILHPAPIRCAKVCPDIKPCEIQHFQNLVDEFEMVENTYPRPKGLL